MNHKIAILSDIHGNATALEAVIADSKNQGVSEYWLLGDIFLPGPGANDLVALLKDLPITASEYLERRSLVMDDHKFSVSAEQK